MVPIEIDSDTYAVLDARAEEKGFEETENYIQHLLEQVAEKIQSDIALEESQYSEKEKEKVKDRLKGLGYLD